MKPARIFLILIVAIGLLIGTMVVFPNGEIRLSENFSLRFFALNDLLHPASKERVDISEILEGQGVLDTAAVEIDSSALQDSMHIDPREIVLVKNKVQYAEGSENALQSFFAALDAVRNNHARARILHYGDSQIEGDRISSVIRQKFQSNDMFGGCGAGMFPVRDIIQGRLGFRQSNSGNWTKYSVFRKSPEPKHRNFSLLGTYFRFTPFVTEIVDTEIDTSTVDSAGVADTVKPQIPPDTIIHAMKNAWFKISKRGGGYGLAQTARQLTLMFRPSNDTVTLLTNINGVEYEPERMSGSGLMLKRYPIAGGFQSATVTFSGLQSPDVYGMSLDCETGISLDNIPMRSAAVADFSTMNVNNLAQQIRELNVRLVILQFGVNVVKNLSNSYGYYEKWIYDQIIALRAAAPDISVLVIGISDMARKEGTTMASYPNIRMIRDAQRNAAFRAGAAFWDLYEAMGGHNSMVSWVHNNPPQAEKDYTHFNPAGARVIGKMIYDALMEEYYRYKGIVGDVN